MKLTLTGIIQRYIQWTDEDGLQRATVRVTFPPGDLGANLPWRPGESVCGRIVKVTVELIDEESTT